MASKCEIAEAHNETKPNIFLTLDEAYNSNLAGVSDEYFQMILCVATTHNHTELIKLMLANSRCDLNSLRALILPKLIRDDMTSTKCHLNDLKRIEQLHRDIEALESTQKWSSLMKLVHTGHDARDVLVQFENLCLDSATDDDWSLFCRQMLYTAEKHNHRTLMNSIYFTGHIMKRIRFPLILSPLFVAIANKNLLLVELFLRAGSRLTLSLTCQNRKNAYLKAIVYVMSAIEQACIVDHTELLKILLSYDSVSNNIERGIVLHFACEHGATNCINYLLSTDEGRASVNTYDNVLRHRELREEHKTTYISRINGKGLILECKMSQGVRRTPLHAAVTFRTSNNNGTIHSPSFVRLLIVAGACVNNDDSNGLNPLNHLMAEVRHLENSRTDITADDRCAIVESARILLEAGANSNQPRPRSPLGHLLRSTIYSNNPKIAPYLNHFFSSKETLPLKTDLVTLLLKHRANMAPWVGITSYFLVIIRMARELVGVIQDAKKLHAYGVTLERCDAVMNMLCDMLRSLLLAGSFQLVGDIFPYFCINTRDFKRAEISLISRIVLSGAFVKLSFEVSPSAPTRRLIRLAVSTLNAWELKRLRESINNELDSIILSGSISEEWQIGARNAILSIGGLDGPRFLQHLARREIIKRLMHKCLLDSTSFEVSQHLNDYILLKD